MRELLYRELYHDESKYTQKYTIALKGLAHEFCWGILWVGGRGINVNVWRVFFGRYNRISVEVFIYGPVGDRGGLTTKVNEV
jgi:hypothetical protein